MRHFLALLLVLLPTNSFAQRSSADRLRDEQQQRADDAARRNKEAADAARDRQAEKDRLERMNWPVCAKGESPSSGARCREVPYDPAFDRMLREQERQRQEQSDQLARQNREEACNSAIKTFGRWGNPLDIAGRPSALVAVAKAAGKAGEVNGARACLAIALSVNEKHIGTTNWDSLIGTGYASLGDHQQAMRLYQGVLKREYGFNLGVTYLSMGESQLALGDREAARNSADQARYLMPERDRGYDLQRRIDALYSSISNRSAPSAPVAPVSASPKLAVAAPASVVPARSAVTGITTRLPLRANGQLSDVTLRAVSPVAVAGDHMVMVTGRKFVPGQYEVVVSEVFVKTFREVNVGSRITLQGKSWMIVGIYRSPQNAWPFDNELWADYDTVHSRYDLP